MAESNVIVAFLCAMFISQASCARVLLADFLQKDVPVKEQLLNLALPQKMFEVQSPDFNHLFWLKKPKKKFELVSESREQVVSKYEPLILNFLPKGTPVPPSTPSKQGNNYVH